MRPWVKYFIFLLAISTTLTALPDFIFPIRLTNKEYVIAPLFETAFLFVLFSKQKASSVYFDKKVLIVVFFFVAPVLLAYLFEPLRHIMNPGRNLFATLINFYNVFIFFVYYLVNLALDEEFYGKSLNLYWKFNYFIVCTAALVFLALHAGIVNTASWGLPSFFSNNFHVKLEMPGANGVYSVPLGITVIMKDYIKPFGIFSQFGTFTGMSYEPHVATFFLTPAFFLTFKYKLRTWKNFFIFYLPFFLFFILSFSVTNIVSLLGVAAIIYVFTLNLKNLIKTMLIVVITVFCLALISNQFLDYINLFKEFVFYKMNSRSGDETASFIDYILTPKSFFGWGIFNIPTETSLIKADDVGFLSCFLIVLMFVQFFIVSMLNLFRRNYVFAAIGFYFMLHAIKFPMHIFLYPFLIFIMFVVWYPFLNFKTKSHALEAEAV
ncbi:MAG: hypothetical protein ACO1O6_01490 [Bacteroidota bacterium]